jgi:hypothetical protein
MEQLADIRRLDADYAEPDDPHAGVSGGGRRNQRIQRDVDKHLLSLKERSMRWVLPKQECKSRQKDEDDREARIENEFIRLVNQELTVMRENTLVEMQGRNAPLACMSEDARRERDMLRNSYSAEVRKNFGPMANPGLWGAASPGSTKPTLSPLRGPGPGRPAAAAEPEPAKPLGEWTTADLSAHIVGALGESFRKYSKKLYLRKVDGPALMAMADAEVGALAHDICSTVGAELGEDGAMLVLIERDKFEAEMLRVVQGADKELRCRLQTGVKAAEREREHNAIAKESNAKRFVSRQGSKTPVWAGKPTWKGAFKQPAKSFGRWQLKRQQPPKQLAVAPARWNNEGKSTHVEPNRKRSWLNNLQDEIDMSVDHSLMHQ